MYNGVLKCYTGEMEVKNRKISSLKKYKLNSKKHPESQIDGIAESIKRFGFIQPVVVDKNDEIIIGHGRVDAAKKAGLEEVPTVKLNQLTDNEVKALRLIDNRIAETDWDVELLDVDIEGIDFDFNTFNVSFDDLLAESDNEKVFNSDPDDCPEVDETKEPITKLGDIWQLGEHRLMCGDSTKREDVDKLMDGEKVDMVFTDPPYGVNEKTNRGNRKQTFKNKPVAGYKKYRPIIGDDSFDTAVNTFKIIECLDIKNIIYWGSNCFSDLMPQTFSWIVWDKKVEEKNRDNQGDCEIAWVKSSKFLRSTRIFRHLWKGMIKESEHGKARVHPTQKPIALSEWCFKNYDPDGKSVLDLFLGSGSTLIACEKTNRKCYGMELDPHYCDVIIKRWQDFTGKEAVCLT